jgi:hypothetical protein
MADNIPTFYVQQFSTNLQLLLQQQGSVLEEAVMGGTHVGAQASPVDQIAQVSANKVIARFAPMPRVDATLQRRWAFPVDYDLPQLIDSFDKLRLLVDPSSHYVKNAALALGRAKDTEIINAFFGTAFTGVEGLTSTSFLSTQVVNVATGAAAATGLTVAKLRAAKKILMQNYVDFKTDPIYCAVTAKQHDDLLAEVQVIDRDYAGDVPVLAEGHIKRFLGINFIHTELLQTGTDDASGTSTAVPIWAKSGMYLGKWEDIMTRISIRSDLQGEPYQAYAKETIGATRLDEPRVVKVWCR